MIVYDRFWKTVKARGLNQYILINKFGVAKEQLVRMRKNLPITTTTIDKFCKILDCDPEDIISYIRDDDVKSL